MAVKFRPDQCPKCRRLSPNGETCVRSVYHSSLIRARLGGWMAVRTRVDRQHLIVRVEGEPTIPCDQFVEKRGNGSDDH